MRRKWMALICLVLAVCTIIPMSLMSLGCGSKEETEEITITIGDLTDLTGMGASAMKPISWALEDYCNYVNTEKPIKGVTLKYVRYDTKYDSNRFMTGYTDLKDQGANVIFCGPPAMGATLKTQAEIDQIPIICASATQASVEPPGWVFTLAILDRYRVPFFLDWLMKNDWTGTGPAKIGLVGYNLPPSTDVEPALKAYCQAHTDQYTLVGTSLVPYTTITWASEVQTYKDCDYLFIAANGGAMASTFVSEYRAGGGKAKLIGSDAFNAYVGTVTDKAGWAAVDGSLTFGNWGYWTLDSTQVALAKQLLETNHPDEAAALQKVGSGAIGGAMDAHMCVELLRAVVEKAGTKDLTGQKIYDTLQEVTVELPGFYPVDFKDGQRQGARYIHVQRWSAADQTLNIITDWMEVPITD